jgi:PAS domain-containing protein
MAADNGLLNELRSYGAQSLFPFYVTDVESGKFLYTNGAFHDLFQCNEAALSRTNAIILYPGSDPDIRAQWVTQLLDHGDNPYKCEMRYETFLRKPIDVIDAARVVNHQDALKMVCGVIVDISIHKRNADRLAAYEEILNLEWINVAVHRVERNASGDHVIAWTNARERQLFGLTPPLPLVEDLLPDIEQPAEKKRLNDKFDGKPLAKDEHHVFVHTDGKTTIPVQLRDAGSDSGEPRSELITALRDVRLENDIEHLLCRFGPNNPLLEKIGVATFEKTYRSAAASRNPRFPAGAIHAGKEHDLVFTQGNSVFVDELVGAGLIKDALDLLGKQDKVLFPKDEAKYNRVDMQVIRSGQNDQRIESHEKRHLFRSGLVMVLKVPVRDNTGRNIIGVRAFYWDETETERIARDLREQYEPWRILDGISVPVYCKDDKLRVIYCNEAFFRDVCDNGGQFSDVSELIGKTDEQLHPGPLAEKYRRDDEALQKMPKNTIKIWRERHGRSGRMVEVRKTHIGGGRIQGVFWYIDDILSDKDFVWIDWKNQTINRGRTVLKKAEARHRPMLLALDYVLERCNEVVTYYELVHRRPALPKQILDEKGRNSAFSRKLKLESLLQKLGLHTLLRIDTIDNVGYRLVRLP